MRAMWSGAVSFGLVNIPVRLYSGTGGETKLEFDLLHEKDKSPIRFARICKLEGEEVPYQELVKGYEYSDGEYVIMTNEDFRKADVTKTRAIQIMDFVKETEIDDIFFEKPYFLEPDKGAAKPYALLREALRQSGMVGIASFVLRNREHIAAIRPSGDVLMLDQLRYASEIRSPEGLKLPEAVDIDKRELDLALALVNQLTDKWQPEKYHDTYTEELRRIIEEKAQGRVPAPKGEEPKPTEVINLMDVLKKSLEQTKEKAA
ncbi:MAG TPA: Ku protein [Armatimonadota bacterium]|nr:Ku protein [Armatimonadota bacterium]